MAKVLIIDDEIHVRNLLKYLIHWEELGSELVGEYDNAEDAIKFMESNDINIVITDIMMPEMNGLEMVEKMQALNRKCKFILISGYRDFEFAQKAVKLGVSDYIVKPINENEINGILRSIVMGIDDNLTEDIKNVAIRKKFVEVINKNIKGLDIDKIYEKYHLRFAKEGCYRVLQLGFCNSSEEDQISDEAEKIYSQIVQSIKTNCIEIETFQMSDLRYDILIQFEKSKEEQILRCLDISYRELVQRYKRVVHYRFYLSVGKAVDQIDQINDSSHSAHFFLSGRLGYRDTRIYVADILPQAERIMKENNPISRENVRVFERCLESIDEKGIREVIRKLFKELQDREEQNHILYFYLTKELCIHMLSVFNRLNVHPSEMTTIEKNLEELMDNCDTVSMLLSMIERFCIDNVNHLLGGKQDNVQVYVNYAKKYINEHYSEDISLQTIADLAHVNSAYLSSVFKKNTGINYLTYLTSVRMEKAKELLCELNLNLSQIANAVGYTSTRYFSKTFENEVGMKPSEYRRVYLRGKR